MKKQKIIRIAFLQEYRGRPETLLDILDEVKEKGYRAVLLASRIEDMAQFKILADKAARLDFDIYCFTGYMKYQDDYIAGHPEQKLISCSEFTDQDGISAKNWGCPFNPDFKERYFSHLRELAAIDRVVEIHVNDEASLSNGCYCEFCGNEYQRKFADEMPLITDAAPEKWNDPAWLEFIRWRIERWNEIHGEIRDAIKAVNSNVTAVFQTSPSVDLWTNPWQSAVDLSSMIKVLDGLSTDPYYTFHPLSFNSANFVPVEVMLSEWCRFIRGLVPASKNAEIIPQAFSHPNFTRPLDERDGTWAGIIPPASGITHVAPYTYSLMKCSTPVIKSYEKCFEYDEFFDQVAPLTRVGLVHGTNTEIYLRPFPMTIPDSYDGARVLPCAEALRHKAIPYGYLFDNNLTYENLARFSTIVLPEINWLAAEAEEALLQYWRQGGNIVILGNVANADLKGKPQNSRILNDVFGIEVIRQYESANRTIQLANNCPFLEEIPSFNSIDAEMYKNGEFRPEYIFNHWLKVKINKDAVVAAHFKPLPDETDEPPALVLPKTSGKCGKLAYFAGFPSRIAKNPRTGRLIRNHAHWLLPAIVNYISPPVPLAALDWPPGVPMETVRPFDRRYAPTFEFFPLTGKDIYLAGVVSYFKETASFRIAVRVPQGKTLVKISELISGMDVSQIQNNGNEAIIKVDMDYEDAAKLFVFKFK